MEPMKIAFRTCWPIARLFCTGRSGRHYVVGLISCTRENPPLPSIWMIHTVCLTSWFDVNWNGPSGVSMFTVSIAARSLSRSPGATRGVGDDLDGGVALRRELVRILAVLLVVSADEVGVRREGVADVPGARAAGALAGRTGLLRDGRRVEAVAAKELTGPALLAGLDHDLGRDPAERCDEDHVGLQLHGLRHIGREVGLGLAELDDLQQVDVVLADRVLDDLASVARELIVLRDQEHASRRVLVLRVRLDVVGDGRLLAEAVAEDVLAGRCRRVVA